MLWLYLFVYFFIYLFKQPNVRRDADAACVQSAAAAAAAACWEGARGVHAGYTVRVLLTEGGRAERTWLVTLLQRHVTV